MRCNFLLISPNSSCVTLIKGLAKINDRIVEGEFVKKNRVKDKGSEGFGLVQLEQTPLDFLENTRQDTTLYTGRKHDIKQFS